MKLIKPHIDLIYKEVQRKGVRYYDVQLELVDHIATAIEQQVNDSNESPKESIERELSKWSEDRLDQFINEKEKALKRYWYRRAGSYMLAYFRLPKVVLTMALALGLFYLLSDPTFYIIWMHRFISGSFVLYILFIVLLAFEEYKLSHSYPPPLLTLEAYRRTISGGIFGISYLFFVLFESTDIPAHSFWMAFYVSFALSVSIVVMYGSLFVFPSWLKKESLKYYEHLGIAH